MALLDVLQARTDRRCRTAQVSCGELGLLSVEALPPAELARLQSDRAVLYAACRELQSAGESLRKAGKIFAPDEITAYLSDEEAASGAAAVREISGVSGSPMNDGQDVEHESQQAKEADRKTDAAVPDMDTARTKLGEFRRSSVQGENHVYSENPHAGKNGRPRVRPDTVQEDGKIRTSDRPDFSEIRLSSVQGETEAPAPNSGAKPVQTERGQDSREFSGRGAVFRKTDKKSQGIVDFPGERTPNLGQNPVRPESSGLLAAHETKSEIPEKLHETTSEQGDLDGAALHEITSDFREKLHEITSESAAFSPELPHEIKSELRETLHETTSELHPGIWEGLHETTSEQAASGAQTLHETKSESGAVALEKTHGTMGEDREAVHESTSEQSGSRGGMLHETKLESRESLHEIRSEVRDVLHEMESELTDRVARGLLDGLRRAAAVR